MSMCMYVYVFVGVKVYPLKSNGDFRCLFHVVTNVIGLVVLTSVVVVAGNGNEIERETHREC